MSARQVVVTVEVPKGWDEEDWEYLIGQVRWVLGTNLYKSSFDVEEIK